MIIYNFTLPDHQQRWRSLDDWIMGGRSSSDMQFCDMGAHFTGKISLANNGGFASIHSPDTCLNLSAYDGVTINVYGDGKQYGFILRDDGPQQLRYQAEFQTQRYTWQTIHLPFASFVPMVMGKQLPFAPRLKRDKISVMGLIVSHQFGDFSLHVQSIEALTIAERQPTMEAVL